MAKIGEPFPLLLRGSPIAYYNTTGGIDTISSSLSLGTTKLRDAQNVNYFPIGGIQWRNGYIKLNTSAVSALTCNGIFMARYSGANNKALLVNGGKLYQMTSLNGTWTDITNGVTVTNDSTHFVVFDILNDLTIMSDDNNTTWQTTAGGTTAVLGGSPAFTSSLFNLVYQGYMFYGQTVESGTRQYDRLRFSDVNAPNSFTMLGSNNFIDVDIKAGGDIRGGVSYRTFLYVFKRRGIYQITFQPTQVNSSGVIFPFTQNPIPTIPNVGTQSHRSIVKFTTPITNTRQSGVELVFFVDQFGIPRIFDGSNTIQIGYPISRSRDTTIDNLSKTDKTQLNNIWSINYQDRNQIWCFMSEAGSQNDTCWVLDYSSDFVWARHKFNNAFACGAIFEKGNGTWIPFTGDYAGTVYEQDNGTNDNGVGISSYAIWGDAVYEGMPVIRCNYPWIEIKGTTGSNLQTLTISVYPDGSDAIQSSFTTTVALASAQTTWGTSGVGGTMTWGTSLWAKTGLTTGVKELGVDAKSLRIKLSNSIKDNTATIEGFAINQIPLGISQV